MRPGTRACYGAAAVGIFAGLLMAAAGAIILLETAYVDGQVGHAVWMLACFMCVAGFAILLVALLCCSCAMCLHASSDTSVHPEEEEDQLEGKKSAGWATPVTNGGIHQVWTPPPPETPTEGWVLSPAADQEVEDLEEVAIVDADEEEEEEEAALEAELAAVEAEAEAEPEPEPEPQPDVEAEEAQEEGQEEDAEKEEEKEGEETEDKQENS